MLKIIGIETWKEKNHFECLGIGGRIILKLRKAIGKGKGKAIPLQAWTGPEDSRRLRLSDFKTIGT